MMMVNQHFLIFILIRIGFIGSMKENCIDTRLRYLYTEFLCDSRVNPLNIHIYIK